MRKFLLFFTVVFFSFSQVNAQVWSYNFGTLVDSITSSSTSATSPTFLPNPSDGSSSAYARVGTGGGAIVVQSNPNIGSGSSLRLQAPTGGSANKFSLYSIPSASTSFGLKFTFSIGDILNSTTSNISSGVFYFFAGNGANYANASTFSGSQTFTGLQFTLGASGATMAVRTSGWYTDPNNTVVIPYGTPTTFVLYVNNGTTSISYTDVNATVKTLAAGTADLYSGSTFLMNISSAGISASTVIDDFMFYGVSSTGNEANMFIDDITYTNSIVTNTLPIRLSSFNVKQDGSNMNIFWETGVETDINYFVVERSTNGTDFSEIGTVYAKNTPNSSYSFTDQQTAEVNYYRLRIQKTNGEFEYGPIMLAKMHSVNAELNTWYRNGVIYLDNHPSATNINVYDISGKKVFSAEISASTNSVVLPYLISGTYIANIKSGSEMQSIKFVK